MRLLYHVCKGCRVKTALLYISRSRASIPKGATKNSWNRNLSRAIIITIATMIMIMYINVPSTIC